MNGELQTYSRRRYYTRAAYRTNLKWGKEFKKLRRVITRIMDSYKENADSELYLDLLCLRTYKVDPFLILFDELKRDRFRNITELDRFKDGYTVALDEYLQLFREYNQ